MFYGSVVALLHMNGSDASTTFTDQRGHTFTAAGNAQIDTAQSKFGGASGLFDASGDYISTPDSDEWSFGSGDFTIECWYRPTRTNSFFLVMMQWNAGSQRSWIIKPLLVRLAWVDCDNGLAFDLFGAAKHAGFPELLFYDLHRIRPL